MKYLFSLLLSLLLLSCNTSTEKKTAKPEFSVQNWADTLDTQNELGLFSKTYEFKEYIERNEKHALFLNAHTYTAESGEEFQDSLLVTALLVQDEIQVVEWEMRDFIRKIATDELPIEHHIAFWDEYLSLEDIDSDGLVEPILVYASSALNGFDDGRINILTYYKGNNVGIRHQSGVLDFDRNTQVDSAFYQLPASIQSHVTGIMENMVLEKDVIFPAGWEAAIQEKKTYFDEK